jgi:hypothetical protein
MQMRIRSQCYKAGLMFVVTLALSSLLGCASTQNSQHDARDGGMDRARPDGGMGGGMHGGMGGGM